MGIKKIKRMQKKRKVSKQAIINGCKMLLFLSFLALAVFSAVYLEEYVLSAVLLGVALVTFGLYFR